MKKFIIFMLLNCLYLNAHAGSPKKDERNMIFSAIVGGGPSGTVTMTQTGSTTKYEERKELLVGFQYQYILTEELVVGGGVLINKTIYGTVGIRF